MQSKAQIMAFILVLLAFGITVLLIFERQYIAAGVFGSFSTLFVVLGAGLFNYFVHLLRGRRAADNEE